MMKKGISIFGIALIIVFVSIFISKGLQANNDPLLEKYDLNGKSTEQLVEYLENKLNEPYGLSASINGKSLIIKDDKDQITIDLEDDLFYLSMAPYFNQTHPCGIHNLVTCRGELKNESFEVKIIDTISQEVIVDKTMTSYNNGFIGVWLPKDRQLTIEIMKDGYQAIANISTSDASNTCLTTLKLT